MCFFLYTLCYIEFVLMNLVEFASWHTFRSKLYYFPVVFEIAVLTFQSKNHCTIYIFMSLWFNFVYKLRVKSKDQSITFTNLKKLRYNVIVRLNGRSLTVACPLLTQMCSVSVD